MTDEHHRELVEAIREVRNAIQASTTASYVVSGTLKRIFDTLLLSAAVATLVFMLAKAGILPFT